MGHILLAEDDSSMRSFLEAALTRSGHTVKACANGEEALACLENEDRFDLLLTDIVMPGIDGIELAERARQKLPTLKVMFITGFMAVAAGRIGQTPDVAAVVAKPFHLNQLVAQVEAALAQPTPISTSDTI